MKVWWILVVWAWKYVDSVLLYLGANKVCLTRLLGRSNRMHH